MQKIKFCLQVLHRLRPLLYNLRIILAALSGEPLRAGKGSHPSVNTGPFFVSARPLRGLSARSGFASACQLGGRTSSLPRVKRGWLGPERKQAEMLKARPKAVAC